MATTPDPEHRTTGEIMVAVDGSESSQVALRWAAALGVPLRVVQTWEYPSTIPLPWSRLSSHTPDEVDDEVGTALAELVGSTLSEEVPVTTEVLRGPAASALITHAAETSPLLMVVGSRGRGGFAGLPLGSVSRHCMEHAPCPVIVVPGPERATVELTLSKIIVGIDASEASDRALDLAVSLADTAGASVVAVHAFGAGRAQVPPDVMLSMRSAVEEELSAQRERAHARAAVVDSLIVDGDPRRSLLDIAAEQHANLLMVGALGAGTVHKHLGPVASYLAAHVTLPLAVVR